MEWNPETRTVSFRIPRWADIFSRIRRWRWAYFLLLVVFLDLLMRYIDQPVAEWVKGHVTGDFLSFARMVTEMGDAKYWLVPIAFVLPFLIASWQAVSERSTRRMIGWGIAALIFIFVCVSLSGILVNILKTVFGRARPELWFDNGYYGFLPLESGSSAYRSFPSGHAATGFALATALSSLFPRIRTAFFLLFAIPVALSRVFISAHYMADIVAGGTIGWWVSAHVRSYFARKKWVFVQRGGEYRIRAPGQLILSHISAWIPALQPVPSSKPEETAPEDKSKQ